MYSQKLGMATRHQKKEIRKGHRRNQTRTQRMAFKMVYRVIGNAARGGDGLGGDGSDNHPADQPRSTGGGNAVDIRHGDTGMVQRCGYDGIDSVEMRPCGDFRHHPAMCGMNFHLRGYFAGKNAAIGTHQRRGCFITAAFDSKHEKRVVHGLLLVCAAEWPEHRPLSAAW